MEIEHESQEKLVWDDAAQRMRPTNELSSTASFTASQFRDRAPDQIRHRSRDQIRQRSLDLADVTHRELERECPRCGGENSFAEVDCRHCGIVFERFRDLEAGGVVDEIALAKHHELLQQWQAITADYQNSELHERFVMDCERVGSLAFAARKYADMLEVAPGEMIAEAMCERILGMTLINFESPKSSIGWAYRVPKLNGLVIFLSAVVTTIGLFLPKAVSENASKGMVDGRLLAAVGAAGLVLSFSIRLMSRER